MTTHPIIRSEIDRLTDRRSRVTRQLAEEFDPSLRAEREAIEARLEELWALAREHRARLLFGDRAEIIRKARLQDRLDRAA